MSDGASKADGGERRGGGEPVHVFDQTNGVLGTDDEEDRKREEGPTSPASFGVPPIVSL